jgi:hypothetical protein
LAQAPLLRGGKRAIVSEDHNIVNLLSVKRALAVFFAGVVLARADVEFAGVFSIPDGDFFLISDAKTKVASDWLKVGDSFEGVTIEAYDREAGSLTVQSGGQTLRLKLRTGAVVGVQRTPKLNSREVGIQFFSKRVADAKAVVRVIAQATGGRWVFTCIEVWKGNENTPKIGDVIPDRPLLKDEAPESHEAILWMDDSGKKYGYTGLPGGMLPGCVDLPANDLRDLLSAGKAIQTPDPTSPSVTPPAGAGGSPPVAADH